MTFLLVAIPLIFFVAWFVPWLVTPMPERPSFLPKWPAKSYGEPFFDIDGKEWVIYSFPSVAGGGGGDCGMGGDGGCGGH